MIGNFLRGLVLLSTCLLFGCATTTPPSTYSYDEFVAVVFSEDEDLDLTTVQLDLSESELSVATIAELSRFGRILDRLLDRPLRLGSLGSAILDRMEFSYAGHLAMHHYYRYFENEHASVHKAQLDRVVEYMTTERDGSLEKPYRALTPVDAILFVQQSGYHVIGSIYVRTNVEAMVLRVMRFKEEGPFDEVFFDLSALYPVLERDQASQGSDTEQAPWPLALVSLANTGDSAAQLSLGRFFANGGAFTRAESLYLAASRANNGYAHMLYGDLYLNEAFNSRGRARDSYFEIAESQYLQAIEYGYHTALRQLGWLRHRGFYGEERIPDGREMLEQAAALDDTLALRYLADLYRLGIDEDVDLKQAASLYEQAAELGDREARIEYYQVIAHPDSGLDVTDKVINWLLDSATNDDALAMLELGNCYVRGCGTRPNFRRALRWYRKAVQTEPENPEVVNSVAWTLAVSDRERIREPEFALEIIEHLMENDEEARVNPMIVDTWAAVHAALGNFDRALELQREALKFARDERSSQALIDELQSHLESFLKGEALTEEVP